MSTTTAKIAALNKTDNTGITPEIARRLYDSLGRHQIAIVDFTSSERTEGVDNSQAGYPRCSWRECGHVVDDAHGGCHRDHEDAAAA